MEPSVDCPLEEIIMAGSNVKILGRDQNPAWKLDETDSGRCYLDELSENTDAVLTEEVQAAWLTSDLTVFDPPPPCPTITPTAKPETEKGDCSKFTSLTQSTVPGRPYTHTKEGAAALKD
jgi:hypothetical protein